MSILHTINSSRALASCRECISKGDIIILIQDGVYAAIDNCLLKFCLENEISVYVLADDVIARGLGSRIPDHFDSMSFDGFVRLSCATDKTVSWF